MSVGIVCGIWYIVKKSTPPAARSPLSPVHVSGFVGQPEFRSLLLAPASRTVLICDGHRCTPPPPRPLTATAISPVPAACETPPARPCRSLVPAAPPLPPFLTFRASPFAQAAWRVPRMEPPAVQLLPAPHSCGDTLRDAARPPRCAAIPHPTILTHPPHTHHMHARSGPPHPPVFTAYL